MKIFYDLEEVSEIRRAVVTTGSFDGVHIGHKTIIERLCRIAGETNGESTLITFHPHPRKVLYPETAGKDLFLINSQKEKILLLGKTGLDNLIILNFTPEFAKISSFDFIRNVLVGNLHASRVIIGFNHHFGHNREGDFEILSEMGKYHGFEVEEIPEQDIENETVSSTRIRKALQEGKIQRANAYLDHYYMIIGPMISNEAESPVSVPGFRIGVEEECKLVPPRGIYACSFSQGPGFQKAMVLIGESQAQRETGKNPALVNCFPLEHSSLQPNEPVTLHFHKMIRELDPVTDSLQLKTYLNTDKKEIEELVF